jgi:hypothetical protein
VLELSVRALSAFAVRVGLLPEASFVADCEDVREPLVLVVSRFVLVRSAPVLCCEVCVELGVVVCGD